MELWQEELICAIRCFRCEGTLDRSDPRILSVYDHKAICLDCKSEEETRPDYEQVSTEVTEYCLIQAESGAGDPRGYCYHHFYPYYCDQTD